MSQPNPASPLQPPSSTSSQPLGAQPVPAAIEQSAALQLLKIEGELREAESVHDLLLAIATLSRGLLRARQTFVATPSGDAFVVRAISGLPTVDRNAPVVDWIEQLLARAHKDVPLSGERTFQLQAYAATDDRGGLPFPFQEAQWVPITSRDGTLLGGLLTVREGPWLETELVIAKRLAATTAHAWNALEGTRRHWPRPTRGRLAIAAVVMIILGFFPVSMSTLAPLEVAPREP